MPSRMLSLEMKVIMRCIDKGCTTIEETVNTVEYYEALFRAEKEKKYQVRAIGSTSANVPEEGCVVLEKAIKDLTTVFSKMSACWSWNPTHPSGQQGPYAESRTKLISDFP